ncbi:MAG: CopG family transcriptional regulator [Mycobacteriaceae bacterium]|nr:CopG family transcriptional regulator [Mycobacteriaceae bacterium]
MRTSMNLPDALLEQAKARASETGRTVTSLVEEGLRNLLCESHSPMPRRTLTSDGLPQGRLLVDIADGDALSQVDIAVHGRP